jgi:hypothetical protein
MEHINTWLDSPATTQDIGWLNNKNREALFLLLDHIEASQNPKYLPALEAWASDTSQRLARRIHAVIGVLRSE